MSEKYSKVIIILLLFGGRVFLYFIGVGDINFMSKIINPLMKDYNDVGRSYRKRF